MTCVIHYRAIKDPENIKIQNLFLNNQINQAYKCFKVESNIYINKNVPFEKCTDELCAHIQINNFDCILHNDEGNYDEYTFTHKNGQCFNIEFPKSGRQSFNVGVVMNKQLEE